MTQTILVTGAKGFVGTYLRQAFAAHRPDARVVALVAPGQDDADVVAADLLDRAAIDDAVAQVRPDVIIHLAAQASVARIAEDGGTATYATNLGGSLNLALAIARHAPAARLLFISSSEVYGASFLAGPVTEASPTVPLNSYAKSKLLAEAMFDAVLPQSAQLIIARPFNHTGPGQGEDFVLPSFAGQVARIESGRQQQMMVGNLDLCRDFLDVRDVVAAYLALIGAAPNLPRRFVCNVASGGARALTEYVDVLRTLTPATLDVVVDRTRLRSVDVRKAQGDAALLGMATNWSASRTMTSILGDLLDHARRLEAGR